MERVRHEERQLPHEKLSPSYLARHANFCLLEQTPRSPTHIVGSFPFYQKVKLGC